MPITGKQMDAAFASHREWLKTATGDEVEAFLKKANPPVPGLDPPWEEMRYRPRQSRHRKKDRTKPD